MKCLILEMILKETKIINQLQLAATQFKVAAIGEGKCTLDSYNRRDFYKITLLTKCDSQLLYANRTIVVNKPALIFTNPLVPYLWKGNDTEDDAEGYFCVFTDDFLHGSRDSIDLQESAVFKAGGEPVYFINDSQLVYLLSIFKHMREEADSDYIFKYDLMRGQVDLVMHEAIKLQPATAYAAPPNAAARIAKLFMNLLNRQFPVDAPKHTFKLKKASDYADKLAVHINHLNAAVHKITGKSTTAHINEKLVAEACSLLSHTDWTIADIAYSLGFEYPSYFTNFYKKHTGNSPNSFRKIL